MDQGSLLSTLTSALAIKETPTSNTLSTGTFLTTSIRSSHDSSQHDETTVQLVNNSNVPYIILVGLNMLDFSNSANLRIIAEVVDKSYNSFRIALNSLGNSVHHASGCSWLQVTYDDLDIQFGHFSTMDDHPWYTPQEITEHKINFARWYATPPNVVVWFTQLDIGHNNRCRAHVFTKDVTSVGFTISITTWGGSKLYCARVAWLAHSSGRPDICSGNFSTHNIRPLDHDVRSETSSTMSFDAGFTRPPKVFMALKLIELNNVADFRVKLWKSNVNAAGMTWHISPWGSSELRQASGSYIAFENDTVSYDDLTRPSEKVEQLGVSQIHPPDI